MENIKETIPFEVFAVYKKREISADEVAAVQHISLRKVSGAISIGGGQYFLKCDCKAKCT
ncbi:Uncharacterized protein FWK35_00014780 [Aphis craccivora]|uniref:Uncharacterized protein n=1 Tax=Aphis craccivora TaxID=307492 RepID=A0A6G0ZJV1_APHCR|nr:Uncharacterized protein FWK35_00014780 [Aphis craccivora]